MNYEKHRPLLNCVLSVQDDNLLAKTAFDEFKFQDLPVDNHSAYQILSDLNGTMTLSELVGKWQSKIDKEDLVLLLVAMQESGLILKNNAVYISGKECMLKIEDEQHAWLHTLLYQNPLWSALSQPSNISKNFYLGIAIETYHLLSNGVVFDSPALPFYGAEKTRKEMSEVFCEENGHGEIFLSALAAEGFSKKNIKSTVPLAETKGLINALAFWSANDPLFFFSCMEIIEGKDNEVDTVVLAMEASGKMSPEFVRKIKAHSLLNIEEAHASFGRRLLSGIEVINPYDAERAIRQTKLFVELYHAFYLAVWNYYSDESSPVLRTI